VTHIKAFYDRPYHSSICDLIHKKTHIST
jgi:hypothetical protein